MITELSISSESLTLGYPLALLLPLLLAALYLLGRRRSLRSAICYPSVGLLQQLPQTLRQRVRKPLLASLGILAVIALAFGAARPFSQRLGSNTVEARNILLSLDLSRSMLAVDVPSGRGEISRITAVQVVVDEFIRGRTGDRIGLVVFGSEAYLQAPLTLDHDFLLKLVANLQQVDAGPATALGDGLGLAVKRVSALKADTQAVVLLTDGVSNSGHVSPLKAAQVAKDLGVKVYTIGVGTAVADPRSGKQPDFDERVLKQIATETGGKYFWANTLAGLKAVYQEIDRLERESAEDIRPVIVNEYYQQWAALTLLALVVMLILSVTVFRVVS